MNVLIAIFIIIGIVFSLFIISFIGFYIAINQEKDREDMRMTDEEIKQVHKLLTEVNNLKK